jgi:hypothetical protein
MKFTIDRRYWSDDNYKMYVCKRFDEINLIRVEIGFGLPANYKIRKDIQGFEWIKAKGHIFRAKY